VLEGPGTPDLAAGDELARWHLLGHRLGGRIVLDQLSLEMTELLELAALGLEVQRQVERWEQPIVVQQIGEERQLGEPGEPVCFLPDRNGT
jgi:hypothetical protein